MTNWQNQIAYMRKITSHHCWSQRTIEQGCIEVAESVQEFPNKKVAGRLCSSCGTKLVCISFYARSFTLMHSV